MAKYCKLLLFLAFLFVLSNLSVAISVEGDLFEGEEKIFPVEGKNHTIISIFIVSDLAGFTHNDERSKNLHVGESYKFSDNLNLELTKIEDWYAGGVRRARFTLSLTSVCGDGTCTAGEKCEADKCCSGVPKDLNSDNSNCGTCNNMCGSNQACSAGTCSDTSAGSNSLCGNSVCESTENCGTCNADCGCDNAKQCKNELCVTFCGNGICEANENDKTCSLDCETVPICGDNSCEPGEELCCADCGCEAGYTCLNEVCIKHDQCSVSSDCDDKNQCTIDRCGGFPKTCSNVVNEFCFEQKNKSDEAKQIQPTVTTNTAFSNKSVMPPKVDQKRSQPSIVSKFLGWLKSIFS